MTITKAKINWKLDFMKRRFYFEQWCKIFPKNSIYFSNNCWARFERKSRYFLTETFRHTYTYMLGIPAYEVHTYMMDDSHFVRLIRLVAKRRNERELS